jgi:hypothetical protein
MEDAATSSHSLKQVIAAKGFLVIPESFPDAPNRELNVSRNKRAGKMHGLARKQGQNILTCLGKDA